MNPILCNPNPSIDIIKMSGILSLAGTQQSLSTPIEQIDLNFDDRYSFEEFLPASMHYNDGILSKLDAKQKSLISVYDNNPQHQQYFQQQSETTIDHHPLVGIIGRSKRSQAFTRRLLLSGFPKLILCDINSDQNNKSNYVSYEQFYRLSPSIVLITDNLTKNFGDLFPQNKEQLIIDARQISMKYFSRQLSHSSISIPGSYRAFGNLSNWEIEHGTQRVGVAIEQFSSLDLLKFIYDLKCFTRGIFFLDQYSYNKQEIRSFHNCLFPFVSTLIIFSICFIFSMIEHNQDMYNTVLIYRQASSITAATSTILLAFLFILRPMLKSIEFIYSIVLQEQNSPENLISKLSIMQYWFQSKCYLIWYSLSFSLLHMIFLIFSKMDFHSTIYTYGFFFGVFTLILLFILSYAHFPWISERLLWSEYNFLTSYLGLFCLLTAFIHVFLQWKLNSNLFNLKFISMISLLIALMLRFLICAIVHPFVKLIRYLKNRSTNNSLL